MHTHKLPLIPQSPSSFFSRCQIESHSFFLFFVFCQRKMKGLGGLVVVVVALSFLVVVVAGVMGGDENNPWDGTWVKKGLRRPPYTPEECGVDPRQICEHSHSQKVNKYIWKPSSAYPFEYVPFDGDELMGCLAGKKIFMQGDSLIRNLQQSMNCLSPRAQDSIIYDQNPFLCAPTPSPHPQSPSLFSSSSRRKRGEREGRERGGEETKEVLNTYPEDVSLLLRLMDFSKYGMVLIGGGVWYTVNTFQNTIYQCENPKTHTPCDSLTDAYPACLKKTKDFLEQKMKQFPGILFVWASKVPRHYVAEFTEDRHCNIPNIPTRPWNSDLLEQFREVEQRIFGPLSKKYPNFLFFDHYTMSLYRADAHPGKDRTVAFGGDCTHFCLPGLPDFWSALLQQHYCYFSRHNHTVFYNRQHHYHLF